MNNKGIKVLSLFDGMSCTQIALNRAGITYSSYHASEIDKYAIKVTQENYPETVQLGDIKNVKSGDYDLIVGGSPCQGFSFAGKQLNFEDSRSKLFFEFVRILKENKKCYFLLENVRMKKEHQDVISGLLGVEPININSKLVSAQLRNRFYWTNIPNVKQPNDKGILLSDVIESGYTDREKSRCILESESRPPIKKESIVHRYFNTGFTTVIFSEPFLHNYIKSKVIKSRPERCYIMGELEKDNIKIGDNDIRYLTQIELERLQTIKEGYTSILSRNKAAGLIGNAFTVDVIVHILNNLKEQIK